MKGNTPIKEWAEYHKIQPAIVELLRLVGEKTELLEMYPVEELEQMHVEVIANGKCIATRKISKSILK